MMLHAHGRSCPPPRHQRRVAAAVAVAATVTVAAAALIAEPLGAAAAPAPYPDILSSSSLFMSASVATAEVTDGVVQASPARQALGLGDEVQSPPSSARYGAAPRLAPMVDVNSVDVTPGRAGSVGSGPAASMQRPLASVPTTTMTAPLVDVNMVDVTPPLMLPANMAAPDALPPSVDVDMVDVTPGRTGEGGAGGAPSNGGAGGPRSMTGSKMPTKMTAGVAPLTDVDTVDVTPPAAAGGA